MVFEDFFTGHTDFNFASISGLPERCVCQSQSHAIGTQLCQHRSQPCSNMEIDQTTHSGEQIFQLWLTRLPG